MNCGCGNCLSAGNFTLKFSTSIPNLTQDRMSSQKIPFAFLFTLDSHSNPTKAKCLHPCRVLQLYIIDCTVGESGVWFCFVCSARMDKRRLMYHTGTLGHWDRYKHDLHCQTVKLQHRNTITLSYR